MTKQFVHFGLVGFFGFLIDAAVLWLASHWLSYPSARALSFWAAVTSNWWLNRLFTFKTAPHQERKHHQWGKFLFASMIGFVPNWGVFTSLMWLAQPSGLAEQAWYPYLAMMPGVLAGMLINFALAKWWVFKA
ncbi:GtrA family protein [Marinomonas ostreistagni]|uniref:GtrA family protein n=1 Tax=Marinomonas ostreistagni TaxID=359209 RepID=UPI001950A503|nr:GtrA family protein [Marinomonas ostreistagni]MBM6550422.1 GtrA family protein [Marinomonas ostreistagni]